MTATPSTCQTCGAEPRPTARFCDSCGSALASTADPAEYKQVTVLFADVVRSMDIAAALGAERLREVMTELVDRAAAVVKRYGGTVDKFTGDGIMALFGAPITLEDHAFRACLAAWDIQHDVQLLAVEVARRDGIDLRLRVGLNSGQVIAGEIGSASIGYTAVGEQVGMAQRMESVAPPGGVMLSESTARLVENVVVLGEAESVRIKGADGPVPARRLLGAKRERGGAGRFESRLVGREAEKTTITAAFERSAQGVGQFVGIVGAPGIGKSRLVRESVSLAGSRGAHVFRTYCESHTREIPFHVVSRLFRDVLDLAGLPAEAARRRVRSRLTRADPEDLLLLDDLLGIRDLDVPPPDVSPDARRRRLLELLEAASLNEREPAVYVVEDAHWIDTASESMLAELAEALAEAPAMMLVTFRPEYHGVLSRIANLQTIALAPLDYSQTSTLIAELLGADPSVAALSALIADRAAGIPFFAEEIVRDLAERRVLTGDRHAYVCVGQMQDIAVPATLQATIGARIDRLGHDAKRTLHAAAVVGARFDANLLSDLISTIDLAPLVDAELVDHAVTPRSEYAFRHPLIQKVAYESQLKSSRSALHRRLAAAIQASNPAAVDENAALIAAQWEAAGDFREAYEWNMRAGSWFNYRDPRAARTSWQHARHDADQLSVDEPDRLAMQIAPRTLLCATTFRAGGSVADTGFDELRELATAAGDKVSLAMGMAGYLTTLAFTSHHRQASRTALEFVGLVESIGDPTTTVALLCAAAQAKFEAGELSECLEYAQRVIDLADGNAGVGNLMVGSPLAWAIALRGVARMYLGREGWRHDLDESITTALPFDVQTRCNSGLYKYVTGSQNGALIPDAADLALVAEWSAIAEQSGDDTAIALTSLIHAFALIHHSASDRQAGVRMLVGARGALARLSAGLRRMADIELAANEALVGDLDSAITMARTIVDEQFDTGELISRGPATSLLVTSLLRRGTDEDLRDAQRAVDRMAAAPVGRGFVVHELPLLRLSALLAGAQGDSAAYQAHVVRYRARAQACGFEGHLAWARAM